MTAQTHAPHSVGALPTDGYIRAAQLVPAIIPIHPATLWRWVQAGQFPSPVHLSRRVTAWEVGAVRRGMAERKGRANG